jgi:hypothetical protein
MDTDPTLLPLAVEPEMPVAPVPFTLAEVETDMAPLPLE